MSNSSDDFLTENITMSSVGSNYSADTFSITLPTPVDTISLDNITISNSTSSSSYNYYTGGGITGTSSTYTTIVGGGSAGTTLGTIDITSAFNWMNPVPFETGFPEWHDFQEMCKEYPGLEKTFEHLKAFYNLCKDDWEAKKKGNND